ncbi:MAG: hypothetical protein ABL973_03815 [Micropepsaceae bacterium]
MSKARFEPAELGGKPADENISRLHVMFRIEGDNRVGVHGDVDMALERAYAMRKKGQFAESLARLRQAYKGRVNLYEMTTLSFGMAASYRGMNDYRRALLHARHATIDNAQFADRGVQRPALELRVELEARDNNPADALCAFNGLKDRDPDFKPDATLQALLDQATAQLGSNIPVRSDVDLVETERTDVEPHWYHPVLRSRVRIGNIQGKLKSYRLVCASVKIEKPFTDDLDMQIDPDAQPCLLYVYGDPGTKFTVDESEDTPSSQQH